MSTEDAFERAYELFRQACELTGEERARYLDRACDSPELRAEVEELLRLDGQAPAFLETPLGPSGLAQLVPGREAESPPADAPQRVGPYRVLRRLGEGGMGVVYLAEQDNPRRTVALKLLRPGAASPARLARFAHEAQLLGRLKHPGIAHIHEAGLADTGAGPQPFFALEYVEGRTLTDAAAQGGLDLRARVELLARVCDAVHHAHQKGVLHRDLKPANILVTPEGQPKVLDFGVGRAIDGPADAPRTHAGELLGTLPYMSPEQAGGDPGDLDVRSDVWALGVVGFELLSGQRPHDFEGVTTQRAMHLLREEEPRRLSALAPQLGRDLDTIVAKALERDRERRYQSALDLAQDLRRFLRHEPIQARPPSAAYTLRKLARRHRGLVLGVAAALLALSGGALVSTWQWLRAEGALGRVEAARRTADDEADKARLVSDFLVRMITSASPRERGSDLKVVEVLEGAESRIDSFVDRPELEAQLRHTLGVLYRHLGLSARALVHQERALALRERNLGERDLERLSSMHHLAITLFELGRLEEAEALGTRTYELQRELLGEEHPETLFTGNNLGLLWSQRGESERAEQMLRETLRLSREALGPEAEVTRASAANLGLLLHQLGRLDEAEELYRESLSAAERAHGPDHPSTLIQRGNLGALYAMQGRDAEAEALLRETLPISVRVLGAAHPDTLNLRRSLAHVALRSGRLEQALGELEELLADAEEALPAGHWFTAQATCDVGWCLCRLGLGSDGAPLLQQGLEGLEQVFGTNHPRVVAVRDRLGECR